MFPVTCRDSVEAVSAEENKAQLKVTFGKKLTLCPKVPRRRRQDGPRAVQAIPSVRGKTAGFPASQSVKSAFCSLLSQNVNVGSGSLPFHQLQQQKC